LLKARIVEPEKQPLLANGYETTSQPLLANGYETTSVSTQC
jgi:hypothetical protein